MCLFRLDLQEMLLERNAKKRHKQSAISHIAYVGLNTISCPTYTLKRECNALDLTAIYTRLVELRKSLDFPIQLCYCENCRQLFEVLFSSGFCVISPSLESTCFTVFFVGYLNLFDAFEFFDSLIHQRFF